MWTASRLDLSRRRTVARRGSVWRAHLALLLGAALAGVPARADPLMLEAAKEGTIYDEGDVSNGKGSGLFTGVNNMGNTRRALLAFDLAGALPAGSTLTSVTLRVVVTMGAGGNLPATLHRVEADWGEGDSIPAGTGGQGAPAAQGDATWNYRSFDTVPWSSPGGDFASTASGQGQLGSAAATFASTPGMDADVQAWLDDPASNFGWILRGSEGTQGTARRLASREESSAADRPRLTVVFDPLGSGATATTVTTPTGTPTGTAAVTTPTHTPTVAPSTPPTITVTPTSPPPATDTPTPTATVTETPVAPTPTATDTPPPPACVGDCDGSCDVTISELVIGVNIALGSLPLDRCPAFDPTGNGGVEINELIAAVSNALNGCSQS